MESLREAIKIGSKDLIADHDFLLTTIKEYLINELNNVESKIEPVFYRSPTARELITAIFNKK